MTTYPKFIQITSSSETARSGHVKPALFALDEEGNVWEYAYGHPRVNKKPQWVPLPTDRK